MSDPKMYSSHNLAISIKDTAKTRSVVLKEMLLDLGLGSNTMSALYHGKSISFESLARIADYLDCSVDYLLGRTDNPAVNRSPLDAARSPIRLAAYDGSDDQPAYTTKEQLDAAPDLEL